MDDAPARCGQKMAVGKEVVRYWLDGDIANGVYNMQLRLFENCGEGPTRWVLRVTVDERVRVEERGSTDGG